MQRENVWLLTPWQPVFEVVADSHNICWVFVGSNSRRHVADVLKTCEHPAAETLLQLGHQPVNSSRTVSACAPCTCSCTCSARGPFKVGGQRVVMKAVFCHPRAHES
eukprot:GHUV01057176.1.p2 GENE.GHUV01057176.1~~GHUV01057176.1.p2  ORF type:complete len:107 (-),score=13.91 GHUV01057176.1:362-682(-)